MITQQRAIQGYEVPCWDTMTLGDELDGKGISWAYYAAPVSMASRASGALIK